MLGENSDAVLMLIGPYVEFDEALSDVRKEVHRMLVEEAWKVAMKSRHYLTTQCLDAPSESAWMMLYKFGSDINFLNATSLTRPAFHQLLRRFSRFYHIPRRTGRGRPAKLRYLHQVLGLVLCFYVGSMEQPTMCMMFGAPPTTVSRVLRRAEEALSKALEGYAPVTRRARQMHHDVSVDGVHAFKRQIQK